MTNAEVAARCAHSRDDHQVRRLAPVSIGALFVLLGYLLPRFRSNFFLAFRTPWTLSSETVWGRTHQVGGYMMVLMALLLIAAGIQGTARWLTVAIGGALLLAMALLVYSHVLGELNSDQTDAFCVFLVPF